MSGLNIVPLTPGHWPAFARLFGPNGACDGCWCMWWRLPRDAFNSGRGDVNRRRYQRVVKHGAPPGLLAFDGDEAIGWCQLCPRSDLPRLGRSRQLAPIDELPVWSLSCFFVSTKARGKGVASALITAALEHARAAGAPAVEAYPWDTDKKRLDPTVFTGVASSFSRLGFKTVARRAPHRPVMRYRL